MKTLKFALNLVPLIVSGEKTSTWRLFDDKDLQVGDQLTFINKETGEEFANARITTVREKRLGDITSDDEINEGHERFRTDEERLATYRRYYGECVTSDAIVKMLRYELIGARASENKLQNANNTKAKFVIGTFGIIFDEQYRVLLCHRTDFDLWNLPGGTLEAGESPADGVMREVKEETGLSVEITKLIGVYDKLTQNELVFSFVCRVVGGAITLNDEADQIEYFEIEKLPTRISSKQVERIRDAMKNPQEVLFKTQTGKSSIDLIKEGKLL